MNLSAFLSAIEAAQLSTLNYDIRSMTFEFRIKPMKLSELSALSCCKIESTMLIQFIEDIEAAVKDYAILTE